MLYKRVKSEMERVRGVIESCFFFFQAEDGIRYVAVTGVQTCALPISISDVISEARHHMPLREPTEEGEGVTYSTETGVEAEAEGDKKKKPARRKRRPKPEAIAARLKTDEAPAPAPAESSGAAEAEGKARRTRAFRWSTDRRPSSPNGARAAFS